MNLDNSPIPYIDLNKCEGHGICTHVCAEDVITMKRITSLQFSQLNVRGKLNALLSNNLKANIEHPERCNRCELCVTACTEGAIVMKR